MNSAAPTVTVVLPIFNEGSAFPSIVGEVVAAFEESVIAGEIILVDDGSTDNSWAEVRRLSEAFPNINGKHALKPEFGKTLRISRVKHSVVIITSGSSMLDSCSPLATPPRW